MADESEQPEIIPKPPSHPITSSLLIVSAIATLIAIGFVWSELFGNYLLSSKGPVKEVDMANHANDKMKGKTTPIDHYEFDYPGEKSIQNLEYNVKQELHIGSKFESGDAGGDK